MRLRRLRRTDAPEYLRMRRTLWPDCSATMHRFEIRRLTRRSRTRAVLVIDRGGDRLGGFIELATRDRVDGSLSDRVGYIEGWYVDADLRGDGWGRRMVRAAETWTASLGLRELASDAELANDGSIRAHRACGFRETFRLVVFLKKVRRKARSP